MHPSLASGHSREEKGKWGQFIIFFVSSIEHKAKYHPFRNMLIQIQMTTAILRRFSSWEQLSIIFLF